MSNASANSAVTALELLKDNFVVVSGLAAIIGMGLATLFLSAYLSVFDWHLLWFVQSTDIITFGLVAVGVIGGSILLINGIVQGLIAAGIQTDKPHHKAISILVVVGSIFLTSQIYTEHLKPDTHYFHIFFGWGTIGLSIGLIFIFANYIRFRRWPNATQLVGLLIAVVSGTICFGQWLGYSVLESSQFDQDVYSKSGTLNGAKLIIVMSRHTILMKDKIIYAVPTADIAQFRTTKPIN